MLAHNAATCTHVILCALTRLPGPMSEIVPRLITQAATKIVLVLIDGLGGVRTDERGSELHAAMTPNLDLLAREGSSGLHTVVAPGVTAGSGAGHLAVFGYDLLDS